MFPCKATINRLILLLLPWGYVCPRGADSAGPSRDQSLNGNRRQCATTQCLRLAATFPRPLICALGPLLIEDAVPVLITVNIRHGHTATAIEEAGCEIIGFTGLNHLRRHVTTAMDGTHADKPDLLFLFIQTDPRILGKERKLSTQAVFDRPAIAIHISMGPWMSAVEPWFQPTKQANASSNHPSASTILPNTNHPTARQQQN